MIGILEVQTMISNYYDFLKSINPIDNIVINKIITPGACNEKSTKL